MVKRLLFIIFLNIFLVCQLFGYDFKRIDSTKIKNNCSIIHITEEAVPWDIYVLKVDLTNKNTKIKTGVANGQIAWADAAGNSSINKETLEHMINRRMESGEDVIGGINSDFFNMANGMQFNVTATNGEIVSTGITQTTHSAIYTDRHNEPYIGLIEHEQAASVPGAGKYAINGTNINRAADYLVIYNSYLGQDQSFANQWGIELLLEPLDSGLINGVRNYKVLAKDAKVTMENRKQIILSGHGKANTFLSNAETGDYIQIYSSFSGLEQEYITEMVGGWGHIVTNGKNNAVNSIDTEGTMEHEYDRHPRSAVGFNKDRTWMYLIAVDGRSDISKGMNLIELADFMIGELNIWEGLNFDGGGSTTLMTGNETINTPSGGTQRAIANALLLINDTTSTATSSDFHFETSLTTNFSYNSKLHKETDNSNNSIIWVVETDLSQYGIEVSPALANGKIGWTDAFGIAHKNVESLSDIVGGQSNEVVSAINASPFVSKSGSIDGTMAANGTFASFSEDRGSVPAICFDEDNIPYIGNIDIDIEIEASNGSKMVVNSVNGVRWIDHLVIYNSFIGSNSIANQWGAEVLCQPQGDILINSTVTCNIIQKEASQQAGTGKMAFADKQFVLSGNSKGYDFINNNISVGQTIKLTSTINLPGISKYKHVVPGSCLVLKNGSECLSESVDLPGVTLTLGNELRSAIGYNQDKSKLYFFASESYSDKNKGLPYGALIEVMKKYNIYDGICMDGGINSTLYADSQLANIDSGDEQKIPNALLVLYDKLSGTSLVSNIPQISVYPNPATNKLYVKINESTIGSIIFELYDLSGKQIISKPINLTAQSGDDISVIPLPSVNTGNYFYRISANSAELKSGNIIINAVE